MVLRPHTAHVKLCANGTASIVGPGVEGSAWHKGDGRKHGLEGRWASEDSGGVSRRAGAEGLMHGNEW